MGHFWRSKDHKQGKSLKLQQRLQEEEDRRYQEEEQRRLEQERADEEFARKLQEEVNESSTTNAAHATTPEPEPVVPALPSHIVASPPQSPSPLQSPAPVVSPAPVTPPAVASSSSNSNHNISSGTHPNGDAPPPLPAKPAAYHSGEFFLTTVHNSMCH